ncbi:hypothetical protein [Altericista sp. CCNU0014]|uniref:hypothetical protein n=1 Tax=Altericista sp. CCNU0014 TaxID=3082949 RepID=UPI00384C68F4
MSLVFALSTVAIASNLCGSFPLTQVNASAAIVSQRNVPAPLPSLSPAPSPSLSPVPPPAPSLSPVPPSAPSLASPPSPSLAPLPAPTPQRQLYQTQGVMFETPPGFSPLQPLGGKTVGVLYPAAAARSRHVSIRLLEIQPSALGIASLGARELSEYVRFSFWGITANPQYHQTRRFMGQSVTGDVLIRPNNAGMSYLEFYLVPLSADRQLAIAFEADTELPVALLEQAIQTVSASLREDPTLKKKRQRRPPPLSPLN